MNDQIIRVGQTNVMGMDFEHVMDTIKKQKTTETNSPLELVFISAQQSSQKKSASRALATPATGVSKSKPSPSTTPASSSKAKARGAKKSTSPARKSSTAGSKANRVRSAGVKTPTSAGRKSSVSAGRKARRVVKKRLRLQAEKVRVEVERNSWSKETSLEGRRSREIVWIDFHGKFYCISHKNNVNILFDVTFYTIHTMLPLYRRV